MPKQHWTDEWIQRINTETSCRWCVVRKSFKGRGLWVTLRSGDGGLALIVAEDQAERLYLDQEKVK